MSAPKMAEANAPTSFYRPEGEVSFMPYQDGVEFQLLQIEGG